MKLRLLFSSSNKIGGLIIRAATFSKWSHVDVLIDDYHLEGALASSGVTVYQVETRLNESAKIEWREIEVSNLSGAHDFLARQVGKAYDWRGIFGLQFNRDWQRDDFWFCSELVAKAALVGGNSNIPKEIYRITPGQLYQLTQPGKPFSYERDSEYEDCKRNDGKSRGVRDAPDSVRRSS